ncbi:MAG: hypothetical protein R3A46_14235 [Thermomicrobiales bacterium]
MVEHSAPEQTARERILQLALSPVGIIAGYTVFAAATVAVLGINLERNRQANALYWLLPAMVILAIFIPYTVTSLAHVVISRTLGFKIDHFSVGPIQLFSENRWRPAFSNQWPTFSSYRITSPGIGNGWKQNVSIYLFAGWMSTAIPLWAFTPLFNRLMDRNTTGQFNLEMASSGEMIYAFSLFFLTFGSWFWALGFTIGGLIIPLRDLILDRERISHHLTHLDPPKRQRSHPTASSTSTLTRTYAVNRSAPEQSAIRPRDWDAAEILALADDWTIQPPNILMLLRAYYHVLDSGEPSLAGSYLVRAINAARTTNAMSHPRLMPEAAYFFARHRGDIQSADMYLKRMDENPAADHVRFRALAAVHLANGDLEQADSNAAIALSMLDRSSPPGLATAEREWLEGIRTEANDPAIEIA